MRPGRLLQPMLWFAYPLVIFFGLKFLEPRYIALLLGATLLLRRRHDAARLAAGLAREDYAILAALLGLAAATALTNSELLLRLYPAAVAFGMLMLFSLSLTREQSMIERFARLRTPDLPPEGVAYTRRVTQVWCAFLAMNGSAALYTAFFATRETWALYNGLIVYLLMGALLAGEIVVRRFVVKPAA